VVKVDLGADLSDLLRHLNKPLDASARELIVLELYRRGNVSSGKAAELLRMSRREFVQHASYLGISYFEMTADEWVDEEGRSRGL